MDLATHCVWAGVALCALGVYCYRYHIWRTSSSTLDRLRAAELKLDAVVIRSAATSADVEKIREGLEKLKAIPPKQPRL